jgi:hypothetical protein
MATFTIAPDIQLDGFFSLVNNNDWFYGFSDDLSVFKYGKQKADVIEAFAKEKGGLWLRIYQDQIAYNNKLTSGNSATARQPQWKDYERSDAPKPTIQSVRHASKEQVAEYLAARSDDNVAVGKELQSGEITGELGRNMVEHFLDEQLYDPTIVRAVRIRDLVVFTPAKGQPGHCYAVKAGRTRIDVFTSPAHFRAYVLKYYY